MGLLPKYKVEQLKKRKEAGKIKKEEIKHILKNWSARHQQ